MRTNAKQRPNQQKADATEQQTTADPKTRDTSTGTGTLQHPTHTHTHTYTTQAKAAGRARRALGFCGVLFKAQQRARGPGTAGSSEVGCGMAGKACGSGNMLAKLLAKRMLLGLLCGGS